MILENISSTELEICGFNFDEIENEPIFFREEDTIYIEVTLKRLDDKSYSFFKYILTNSLFFFLVYFLKSTF